MSKYKGPIFKKARRFNFSILENGKEFNKGKKKTSVVLGHVTKRRGIKNESTYKNQLIAKQQVKYFYNMTDKQLKRFYKKATKDKVNTNYALFKMLESRLDNIVYRCGFASTRAQARQMVNHNHILVNDKKLNIPSAIVEPGSKISIKPKFQKNTILQENIKNSVTKLSYIELDKKNQTAIYKTAPRYKDVNPAYNLDLVIEYYNYRS